MIEGGRGSGNFTEVSHENFFTIFYYDDTFKRLVKMSQVFILLIIS